MVCYICHKHRRLLGPMSQEEAVQLLFELRATFKGLYIEIVDEKTGKVIGRIPKGRN